MALPRGLSVIVYSLASAHKCILLPRPRRGSGDGGLVAMMMELTLKKLLVNDGISTVAEDIVGWRGCRISSETAAIVCWRQHYGAYPLARDA